MSAARPGFERKRRAGAIAAGLAIVLAWSAGSAPEADAQDRRSTLRGGRSQLPLETQNVDVLAWIGETPITRQDLEERLDELSPQARQQFRTPEGRRQLLDRMIEEQVWLQMAERAGVAERPEIRRQLEAQRRNLLVRTHLQEVMQGVEAPSDSAVEAYYEEHRDEPQYQSGAVVTVRHIQLTNEKDARRVVERLRRGEDFERLAERLSEDGATKGAGGRLGPVERNGSFGSLGRQIALAESAFAAPVGVPVGPVQSSVGWHVLRVDERRDSEALPLSQMRARIVAALSRESQERYYRSQLEEAKQAVELRWNESAVDTFLYGRKTPAELFREAQESPTPDGRIAGYRRVLEQDPTSEYAPQALFMIGFVYSEEKKDYDSAERTFRELIAKYPKSELVTSADWMLEHMRDEDVPEFHFTPDPPESGTPENPE